MRGILLLSGLFLCAAGAGRAELKVWPDFYRPAPSGEPLEEDCPGGKRPRPLYAGSGGAFDLRAPRNGYVSFHLTVEVPEGTEFTLSAEADKGIEVDLYREWFHRRPQGGYYPDALVPVRRDEKFSVPDREMRVEGQKAQAFWVDVWVDKEVRPGRHQVRLRLGLPGAAPALTARLRVLRATVPDEDALTADHNCYGSGWVGRFYRLRARRVQASGREWGGSKEFFSAIHETYRMFYEHRGLFHDLGYSHSGSVNRFFAPELEGSGRKRRVKSWEMFDRHFGPLLDGSAFAGTRRGRRPIECMYLTINPEWPARYLNWGRPAYEVEFVNVVSAMERHFRQKGWTHTEFEMFFNHKKRYKGFAWDGDETRFPKDNAYFKEFGRLLRKAVPADSPVKFRFRHDASWLMRQQFDELAGVVDFWVCSGGIFSFYPEAPRLLKSRGDKVWIYGGTPSIFEASSGILGLPVKAWMFGIDGYIRWLVTGLPADPWFKSDGARTALIYPGDRFGIDGILPSVRLKLERNALQDIALLEKLAGRLGADTVRRKVAALAQARPEDWWNPYPPITKKPPWEWSNAALGDAAKSTPIRKKTLDAAWWLRVRDYILASERALR